MLTLVATLGAVATILGVASPVSAASSAVAQQTSAAMPGISSLANIPSRVPATPLEEPCGYTVEYDWAAMKGKSVALVAHGWRGTSLGETARLLSRALDDDWYVVPFAYAQNLDWPDASGVTECFQEHVRLIAGATERTVPSVYVVGHSMGGILARFAFAESSDFPWDALVGGVVTLDTPHRGSPWGDSKLAEWLSWWDSKEHGDTAANCLALHHPGSLPRGCGYPPAIASEIPVYQVAGVVTLTQDFFMIGRRTLDTDSDGIVWLDSQAGYRMSTDAPQPPRTQASSYVVRCEFPRGYARTFGADRITMDGETSRRISGGTTAFRSDPFAVAALTQISIAASCGHSLITTNPEAISVIATQLSTWGAAQATKETPPWLPAELDHVWCTIDGGECVNFDAIRAEYPDFQLISSEGSMGGAGTKDYAFCYMIEFEGGGCTTAASAYYRLFPPGVEWDCEEYIADDDFWPGCEWDFTAEHDSNLPRLLQLPNHQHGEGYIDSRPMYREGDVPNP